MAIEMKKTKVKMNKPIYLGMSILDISKILMYEFWYDYIQDKAKLCYMDTDSFIIHTKTEDFYKDVANDIEKWFDTSNYDEDDKRLLPIGKIIIEIVGLRAKTYTYLMNDNTEKKKRKGTKMCVIKQRLIFKNYIDCLLNNEIIFQSQQ